MGLQSALTTALTGLQAAETTIDVAGNNVANSSTDGFKQSHVLFANQFFQTQSIGSQPTDQTGGTNPRQVGLGVKVAAINPDFSQGTIQVSSNPLDVAIQGDGFLIVQGPGGQQYTRNGQLQTNSKNQLVNSTGNIVLGQAADANFNIDPNSALVPLTIPLGSQSVAQATKTATFSGVLTPNADIGTDAVITSAPLGDATVEHPVNDSSGTSPFNIGDFQVVGAPPTTTTATPDTASGTLAAGTYEYEVTWFASGTATGTANESAPSASVSVTLGAAGNVTLDNLPTDDPLTSIWTGRKIYRKDPASTDFKLLSTINNVDSTTPVVDDGSSATTTVLNSQTLSETPYSYYVAFNNSTNTLQSRPSALIGPVSAADTTSRIRIDNLPQPTDPAFTRIQIFRNTTASPNSFQLVDEVPTGTLTYIDNKTDTQVAAGASLDLVGAKAGGTTKLTDVVIRDGDAYTQPFQAGTLSFAGTRGGRTLDAKTFTIDANSTIDELRTFMSEALGIDPNSSVTNADGSVAKGELTAGSANGGRLQFTSYDGEENSLGIDVSSLTLTPATTGSTPTPISLGFAPTAPGTGQGSTTDFVVYDKKGSPVNVHVTTVVEDKTDSGTVTYRWFASSEDNQPALPASGIPDVTTFLNSGTLQFNSEGKIIFPADGKATINIKHPASDPLSVTLDFSQISGLDQKDALGNSVSEINLNQQDGFAPGSLTSATITESGLIRGVFSNGAERSLGQLRMARFNNATGLEQEGNNLYSEGINSGAAIIGNPGDSGNGTLTSGAVELSNSDIGQNLIDLILASTQYRGGARVITTTQQLFDELLNLRR
ncbi:MAG TPA: flagellar hook-basal body complex protein [Lacipirellulaceae bacterium]|jgi:flagellar hook protein FlgE